MQEKFIKQTPQRQNRMPLPDARSAIVDDGAHCMAHVIRMAANLTRKASVFRLAKGAVLKALMGIVQQLRALSTEAIGRRCALVMMTTVKRGHHLYGALFATNARSLVFWPTAGLARRLACLMPRGVLRFRAFTHDQIMRQLMRASDVSSRMPGGGPALTGARQQRSAHWCFEGWFVMGLGLAAIVLANGCAHQAYPDLDQPDPLAQDLPQVKHPSWGVVQGSSSHQPATASATTEIASGLLSVAEDGQQMHPKAKLPDPPDSASLPPATHRRIEILLGNQRFQYFEDDQLLWSGPISSGTRQHPTPRGRFRVQSKNINKRSGSYTNSFNQPTPMPYSLQFHGPYFIHEGYLPGEPASRGCVRLRYEDAKFIFERMRVGDWVSITL